MTDSHHFQEKAMAALSAIKRVNAQEYTALIELLAATHATNGSVIVSGIGKTGLIGRLFASGLKSVGYNAFFVHASEAAHGDLGALKQGDVVCVMSKSGQSQEVFALLEYAKELGLATVVMAMNRNSYPMQIATHPLYIPVTEECPPVTLLPSVSNVVFTSLVEQIKVELAARIELTTEDFVRTHPGGKIGRTQQTVASALRIGDAVPIVARATPLAETLAVIADKQCGCALVCEEKRLIGIVTDGDVRRLVSNQADAAHLTAQDLMHQNPTTVDETASIETALLVMAERGLSQLPVTTPAHSLCGIVHIGDLVRHVVADFDVVMDRQS